jgi:hypothetical protein
LGAASESVPVCQELKEESEMTTPLNVERRTLNAEREMLMGLTVIEITSTEGAS